MNTHLKSNDYIQIQINELNLPYKWEVNKYQPNDSNKVEIALRLNNLDYIYTKRDRQSYVSTSVDNLIGCSKCWAPMYSIQNKDFEDWAYIIESGEIVCKYCQMELINDYFHERYKLEPLMENTPKCDVCLKEGEGWFAHLDKQYCTRCAINAIDTTIFKLLNDVEIN